MMAPHWEMLLRMGAAAALGAGIGYERERNGRPAGLRTHLLVSLASATFMLVSTQFVFFQPYGKDDLVNVDTSRIAASVVAGVGFLGAGAILRVGLGVQGLTTAASLWLVAAVGLAAGGGMYVEAAAATALTLFALVVLRRVEGRQWRLLVRRLAVVLEGGEAERKEALERIRSAGAAVSDVGHDRDTRRNRSRLLLELRVTDAATLDRVVARLEELPSVRRVQLRKPGE